MSRQLSIINEGEWERFVKSYLLWLSLCVALSSFLPLSGARAQDSSAFDIEAADKNVQYEVGFMAGRLLPNQIDGVTEILPQWGLMGGVRMGDFSFLEGGFRTGSDKGVTFSDLHVSIRADAPLEALIGIVYLGADLIQFNAPGAGSKAFGGAHVGGGFLAPINDFLWFRGDMKFHINPGTALYISGGFSARF